MRVRGLQKTKLSRVAYWLIILVLVTYILIKGKSILLPLILAIAIWYLIRGIKNAIGKIKIGSKPLPGWIRGSLALIIIIAVLAGVSEMVAFNLNLMTQAWPKYQASLRELALNIANQLDIDDLNALLKERLTKLDLKPLLTGTVSTFTGLLGNSFMTLIYVLFLILEESVFHLKLKALYSEKEGLETITGLLNQLDKSINGYIVIKTGASLLTAVLSYTVLALIGVDFPFFWAFLIFVLNYIPAIGSMIATLFPSILALLQFGSLSYFFLVLVVVGSVQVLVGNVIEPRVMGNTLNLSTLVVIISLTFWGSIWGVIGMILSVPITVIITIILAQFPTSRSLAILLSEKGQIASGMLDQKEQTK